jgi:hypothetical protein
MMFTITLGATTYHFAEQDTVETVETSFTNARVLNAGNKISRKLNVRLCENIVWPTLVSLLVGRQVVINGSVEAVISDETSLTADVLSLTYYELRHDVRGEI